MNEGPLEVSKVAKRFGRVRALSDVSLSLPAGAVTSLLGENGAGKTTLLRLSLGFLRPDSGEIACRAAGLGYVPERPVFFPWLRGRDIIDLTAGMFGIGRSELAGGFMTFADRIGFDVGLLDRRVSGYSLGSQKKLAYVQSLALSPDLLIVDEPFSALDPLAIRNVREVFADLARDGRTVLLSSHLIGELERISDRIIILRRGRVVVEGDLEDLRRLPSVRSLRADGGTPTLESLYFFFTS